MKDINISLIELQLYKINKNQTNTSFLEDIMKEIDCQDTLIYLVQQKGTVDKIKFIGYRMDTIHKTIEFEVSDFCYKVGFYCNLMVNFEIIFTSKNKYPTYELCKKYNTNKHIESILND